MKQGPFQAVVWGWTIIVLALISLGADANNGLWKMGASGMSSRYGNSFVVTAEYVGPTTSSTNSDERKPSQDKSYKPLPAKLKLHTGYSRTHGTKFSAGYYRGVMVLRPEIANKLPDTASRCKTNLVSVFSSPDLGTLIIAVDNGPIYSSANAGVTWKVNWESGKHEFPLDAAADGSGLFAEIYVPPNLSAKSSAQSWYVNASSQNGNSLALSGNESAPVLSIRYSNGTATITWSLTSATFVLQQNADLTTTNWTDVNLSPTTVNGLNQVVISPAINNQFYRLKKLE
jgi:hypothetical protein